MEFPVKLVPVGDFNKSHQELPDVHFIQVGWFTVVHRTRERSQVLEHLGPADPEERPEPPNPQSKQSAESHLFPWRW